MAELRDRMMSDTSLSPRKRRDLAWAIRSVARVFGESPDTMPADPKFIGERLDKATPAAAGLTEGTWRNAVNLVRFALRRAGILKSPARQIARFAPAWTALMKLPAQKYQTLALSRLARFCSSHGIEPEQVDDGCFASFLDDLMTNTVMKKAHKVHQRAAIVWNKLANSQAHWPSQPVKVPSYSKIYFLGWDAFPATLVADIDCHIDHLSGKDILSDLAARPLKPSSLRTRRHQLGAYLSGLVLSGLKPEMIRTLADAVDPANVRLGLRFLLDRAENGSKAQAHDVARMLLSVARHWVKAPPPVLDQLKVFCKRLDDDEPGLSTKNMTRLRQFDETDAMERLIGLPSTLVRKASRTHGKPTQADALLVQTALCVELLLMLPMRRENLARLNVDKHIVRHRSGSVYIMIDAAEVKNQVAIEAKLPAETVKLLDLYMAKFRPQLTSEPSPWLFPGLPGRPKSRERLALQVSETIKRELGLLMNMHLFRHAAAKFYLDRNPGAYGVVQRLHGHKSIQTTIRSYCGLEAKSAIEHYDRQIIAERQKPTTKRGEAQR